MKKLIRPLVILLLVSLVFTALTAFLPVFPFTLQTRNELQPLKIGFPFTFVRQTLSTEQIETLEQRDMMRTFTLPRYDLYKSSFSFGEALLSWLVNFAVFAAVWAICRFFPKQVRSAVPVLIIETHRSAGAGGQHVNKTESAIRIIHVPTGTVVDCQDERSQYKNKDKAMKILRSKIFEKMQSEQDAQIAADRKNQVGSGDRSERIRTYNFPQGRVTDHRINLTLYKIDEVMNGTALDEIIEALITEDQLSRLSELD